MCLSVPGLNVLCFSVELVDHRLIEGFSSADIQAQDYEEMKFVNCIAFSEYKIPTIRNAFFFCACQIIESLIYKSVP